jgi:hypothetical protein
MSARCCLDLVDPADTIFSASMSRPESVSSITASVGSSMASCRISLRFFSPPEKPSFTERSAKAGSISSISIFSSSRSWKSKMSISSPRLALSAVRRKLAIETPGISTGYWKARKIPAWARSSGSMSSTLSPRKRMSPSVTS